MANIFPSIVFYYIWHSFSFYIVKYFKSFFYDFSPTVLKLNSSFSIKKYYIHIFMVSIFDLLFIVPFFYSLGSNFDVKYELWGCIFKYHHLLNCSSLLYWIVKLSPAYVSHSITFRVCRELQSFEFGSKLYALGWQKDSGMLIDCREPFNRILLLLAQNC